MFVPSAESLLNALNLDEHSFEKSTTVQVPGTLLKLLLQIALVAADFDEEGYLMANPDVKKAIDKGTVESGHVHYIGFGYFEGRRGGGPTVNEKWYLTKYPDVADAVKAGLVRSADEHFHTIGAGEGRSPGPEYETDAMQWHEVIRPRAVVDGTVNRRLAT